MVDKELLEILVCPEDKTALTPADAALLASLNARIRQGGASSSGLMRPLSSSKSCSRNPFTGARTASVYAFWPTTLSSPLSAGRRGRGT